MPAENRLSSKGIALFWCITLFAMSYGIFTYSSESRPWWLTACAYLASLLAFGAFLEFFKKRGRTDSERRPVENGVADKVSVVLSDDKNDLIGEYGKVLENRKEMVGREGDLPGPKQEIRSALVEALNDPVYQLGRLYVERCLLMLETFVPDDEFDSTNTFVGQVLSLAQTNDQASISKLYERASESQQRAVDAVLKTMIKTERKRPGSAG